MTHKGLVAIVLDAPAAMADIICNDHGCSLITGWYPFGWAAGYSSSLRRPPASGCSPKYVLIPSYTAK